MRGRRGMVVMVALALGVAGCPRGAHLPGVPTRVAPVCPDHAPLRRPLFGDLHVHTARSFDAWLFDTRATPDDAYRFARGEPITAPPLDAAGRGTRTLHLDRPLDFAAITDHAEWFGEVSLCTTPGSGQYATRPCRAYRGEAGDVPGQGTFIERLLSLTAADPALPDRGPAAILERSPVLCAGDDCAPAAVGVWQEMQDAAARHDTPCTFTTFNAYEYSASPQSTSIHRNVVFRNTVVPAAPVSWIDAPAPRELWARLAAECLDAGTGCEVLAIPHNPNLSNGRMFTPAERLPEAEQRARAALRARVERLVEIAQAKGASECRRGMWRVVGDDEACDFEQFRPAGVEDCAGGAGVGALGGRGCTSRLDFVRYALVEGLRQEERLGVNPYKLGVIASTDTHVGDPGAVSERGFAGVSGVRDATPEARLAPDIVAENPGGLVGVWAEENTRDAIFDALQRRETFGTSGPRIAPRLFGGWAFPADLCDDADLVERAYAGGVPMGGDLPPPPGRDAPVFVVTALRDPGTATAPGGLLERAQIVKGWAGADGRIHQAVYDVAGGPDPRSGVDPATCEAVGPGASLLCGVWRDPDFDPARRAVYYARVLESPSCRWSTRQCLTLPAGAAGCPPAGHPALVQERAWTSPIWYTPGSEESA